GRYSRTDPDVRFMHTKEDRLGKGEQKACYNWQIGAQNQYVLYYSTHQTATDIAILSRGR
ncbi:MAG: IS5/IS1182 family transposase, partial [Bacteroidota bacterium]